MTKLKRAVLSTLRYCDYFSYPLTHTELYHRLIGQRASRQLVLQTVKLLIRSHSIGMSRGYYYLRGRKNIVDLRRVRQTESEDLYKQAQNAATRLARIPGIVAIYLTGSLAMRNTQGEDDIDFMIITREGRLWITRLLVTIVTSVWRIRRTPNSHHNKGKLCLNLYLTPIGFALPASRRSLYTAYELVQAIPLYDPNNTREALLSANSWIYELLPNEPSERMKARITRDKPGIYISLLETFCYRMQKMYMSSRITREYITPDAAFFHPQDPGKKVLRTLAR